MRKASSLGALARWLADAGAAAGRHHFVEKAVPSKIMV